MDASTLVPVTEWSAAIGTALPALVAVVNRAHWAGWIKAIVVLLSSLVVGFLTALFNGQLNGLGVSTAVLTVFLAALVTYQTWWKPSGIAPAIEKNINAG